VKKHITLGIVVILCLILIMIWKNNISQVPASEIFKESYSTFLKTSKPVDFISSDSKSRELFLENNDFNLLNSRNFINKESWQVLFLTGAWTPLMYGSGWTGGLLSEELKEEIDSAAMENNLHIEYKNKNLIQVNINIMEALIPKFMTKENNIWKFDFSQITQHSDIDESNFLEKLLKSSKKDTEFASNKALKDFLDWLYVADDKSLSFFKKSVLKSIKDGGEFNEEFEEIEKIKIMNEQTKDFEGFKPIEQKRNSITQFEYLGFLSQVLYESLVISKISDTSFLVTRLPYSSDESIQTVGKPFFTIEKQEDGWRAVSQLLE